MSTQDEHRRQEAQAMEAVLRISNLIVWMRMCERTHAPVAAFEAASVCRGIRRRGIGGVL